MARIRTIKPDFWEDETVATLSLRARLLFIATWNMADDEGLLRWSPEYVKANSFVYDGTLKEITAAMQELVSAELVFPYKGGKTQQQLAYIVNFRKHQRINRPQPSKLPPPSLQSLAVREMYARRDHWRCHLCKEEINRVPSTDERFNLSIDHLICRHEGGTDYPSNVKVAHCTCNKSRRNKPLNDSPPHSVNESVNGSAPEGKGKEQEQGDGVGDPPTPQQAGGRTKSLRSNNNNPRAVAAKRAREKLELEIRDCPECGDASWTCTRCVHRQRRLAEVAS